MLPLLELALAAAGYGFLAPAAVTVVALVLAFRWGKGRGGWVLHAGEAGAVCVGLAAGYLALAASGMLGWAFLRPADCWDWLPGLALLAVVIGVADGLASLPEAARWGLRAITAVVTGWLLVRAQSSVEVVPSAWVAALALTILALWGLLEAAARRWPGFGLPFLLFLAAVVAALVVELSGFMKVAQEAGVLAGVLAGCAGVAWRQPAEPLTRAAVPVLAVLLPGTLFAGYFNTFSDVPPSAFLLVLAGPLLLGATLFLPLSRLGERWRWAVRAVVTLVPLAVAVTLAAMA